MTSIDSFNDGAWPDVAAPARGRPWWRALRQPLRSLGLVAALVFLVAAGLEAATVLVAAPPDMPAPPRSLPEAWLAVRRPLPLYMLTGTEFAKLPLRYAAVRHEGGGGRRDTLTFGDPSGDKSWLTLSLYRVGAEAARASPGAEDFDGLARQAGRALSSQAAPTRLATRFGVFEAVDVRVASPSGPSPCLGFRSQPGGDAALRIAGLACGTVDRPIARDLASCIIDRIDLLSAGDDNGLRDIFVAAERRRGPACLPVRLTSAGSRMTWLDANTSPPLLKTSSTPRRGW